MGNQMDLENPSKTKHGRVSSNLLPLFADSPAQPSRIPRGGIRVANPVPRLGGIRAAPSHDIVPTRFPLYRRVVRQAIGRLV